MWKFLVRPDYRNLITSAYYFLRDRKALSLF
nr:MAG TPA: UBA-like domain protein [Caudoviricetes sp.]